MTRMRAILTRDNELGKCGRVGLFVGVELTISESSLDCQNFGTKKCDWIADKTTKKRALFGCFLAPVRYIVCPHGPTKKAYYQTAA